LKIFNRRWFLTASYENLALSEIIVSFNSRLLLKTLKEDQLDVR